MNAIIRLNKLAETLAVPSTQADLDALRDSSWRNQVLQHDAADPLGLDEAIEAVIEDLSARKKNYLARMFSSELSESARLLLLSFASRMAECAVRTREPMLVVRGLSALAAEGGATDLRDTLVVLAKLFHASQRLEMNSDEVFSTIARLCTTAELSSEMESFPSRPSAERSLEAFGLREFEGPNGFVYQQVWRS